jgi:hypothetical protein
MRFMLDTYAHILHVDVDYNVKTMISYRLIDCVVGKQKNAGERG